MAFCYHLSDRDGKKLKQGLRPTMMTSLAVANAVTMSICSSLCVETSVATLLCRREAGDACPRPDSGGKDVAFNTTGYFGRHKFFKV
ncbi:hypothetical protein X736_30950 [Mesorhizobium sp. L2C089B000]|nr:hypothetical protein X736_30950 [Mesorhizobium sp. L2C089B000]